MKRFIAIVLLGCAVLVSDWATAQPPEVGDEPPVRLKAAVTSLPSTEPVTLAVAGPPYCMVQAMSVRGGAGLRMAGLFLSVWTPSDVRVVSRM